MLWYVQVIVKWSWTFLVKPKPLIKFKPASLLYGISAPVFVCVNEEAAYGIGAGPICFRPGADDSLISSVVQLLTATGPCGGALHRASRLQDATTDARPVRNTGGTAAQPQTT